MKKYSRIFIDTSLSLEQIAFELKKLLNARDTNIHSAGPQLRYGDNYGGEYYLIECMGLEVIIIENTDDALIDEYGDYKFYLLIQFIENTTIPMNSFAQQVNFLLRKQKFNTLIDESF